ncbi:MAG TPA: TolC family protein, partial [Thermoanaerobaculia bacterium]
ALPLFTGGELSGRIDQARLAAAAASGTSTWTADNAALSAAEAYVMVAQAEEYAALLHKSRDTVAAHVKLAGDYVTQGMLVRSELLRAEVELARMDDLVTEADGRVRIANANLAFRLGAAGESSWSLAPLPDPVPVAVPVDGWLATAAARTDLSSAQKLLAAGELEEKVKQAPFWPKIALVAKGELYGDKPFGSSGRSGSLMAVATWNVFQGGADRAAVVAARADARAGREDVARSSEGVRLEVRKAFEEAKTAEARHATAKKALEAAREGERITNDRFRSGVVKTLDLLDVTTARREAETRELVARADAHTAALKLAVKAGRRPESVLNGGTE